MSHKLKTPTKEVGASALGFNDFSKDVLKTGYLRKLKKMKRKFFVLKRSAGDLPSRLEYYPSEKKWRSGYDPKRTVILQTCFNISRKLHPKHKCVLCLYTPEECFSIVMETEEELDEWLSAMLELQLNEIESCEETRPVYEHVWQVVVDDRELEFNNDLSGPQCLGLTSKSISLIRLNSSSEKLKVLEFPLMSIRRCGHSGKHFFIELGRSAITGAGGMWMETEGTVVAQNMHETILSAMKSSRNKGESGPLIRPRSASTSENSKPIATRRPVGVVLPQPLPLSSTLSNSRERCDTMPCRSRTISENFQDPTFTSTSTVSSVNSYYREDSRPHSFYAWPHNSPSINNLSFSPSLSTSISSNLMMSDDMDENIPPYQLSHRLHTPSSNTSYLSEPNIQEIPDPYLTMSPTDSNRNIIPERPDYFNMNPSSMSHSVSPTDAVGEYSELFGGSSPSRFNSVDYMDMKSPRNSFGSNSTSVKKRSNSCGMDHQVTGKVLMKEGYVPMAPCGTSEDLPVSMQDGYLSMSPVSTSLPKQCDDLSAVSNFPESVSLDQDVTEFKLDKVQALVKQSDDDEQDFIKPVRAYSIGSRSQIYESRARAYSVGSENTKVNLKKPVDDNVEDPPVSMQSAKSNSAPVLQNSQSEHKPVEDTGYDFMEIDYRKLPEHGASSDPENVPTKKSIVSVRQQSTNRPVNTFSPLLSLDEVSEKMICKSKMKPPTAKCFPVESTSLKMRSDATTLKQNTDVLQSLDKNYGHSEVSSSAEIETTEVTPTVEDSTSTTQDSVNKIREFRESNRSLSNRYNVVNDFSTKIAKSSISNSATTTCSELHSVNNPSSRLSYLKDTEKAFIARSQSFESGRNEGEHLYPMTIPVALNTSISKSPSSCNVQKVQANILCSAKSPNLLTTKSATIEKGSVPGEYMNLHLKQPCMSMSSPIPSSKMSENQARFVSAASTLPIIQSDDRSYMNIKLGKPYTPLPNPALVSSSHSPLSSVESLKTSSTSTFGEPIQQRLVATEASALKSSAASTRSFCLPSLPVIRKQMSAPAVPASLQHEIVSPGRKSSCPVTASGSMVKGFAISPSSSCKGINLSTGSGGVAETSRTYFSRTPDHECVALTDSTAVRISPKVATSSATGNTELGSVIETQYENVNLPSTSSASSSRPSSVSSEKELNYISLDLAPSGGNDTPHSPRSAKLTQQQAFDKSESLTYAEIDFTKSEGLRHTSGALREGRL